MSDKIAFDWLSHWLEFLDTVSCTELRFASMIHMRNIISLPNRNMNRNFPHEAHFVSYGTPAQLIDRQNETQTNLNLWSKSAYTHFIACWLYWCTSVNTWSIAHSFIFCCRGQHLFGVCSCYSYGNNLPQGFNWYKKKNCLRDLVSWIFIFQNIILCWDRFVKYR